MELTIETVAWLAAGPGLAALALYAVLRWRGLLRVNTEGWNASTIHFRRRMIVEAFDLYAVFEPLMRHEARLRRWLEGGRKAGMENVSEVEVELVSMG